jgi:hypothetical protein
MSPLAEKRIIFSTIKKQMIGRRAYTDSIYNKSKSMSGRVNDAEEQNSSPSSRGSSPKSTESAISQSEIELKSFTVFAC